MRNFKAMRNIIDYLHWHFYLLAVSTVMGETSYITYLTPIDTSLIEDPEVGRRTVARRIVCTISEDGVEIDSPVADDVVLSYELWDEAGNICLVTYVDEHEFVEALAMFRGTYQLRFLTTEYALVGYISL